MIDPTHSKQNLYTLISSSSSINMNVQQSSCEFIFYIFILCCTISTLPQCSSQSNSQNIETFYPSGLPPVTNNQPPPPPESRSSSDKSVMRAVVATAASTVVVSALLFIYVLRYARQRRNHVAASASLKKIQSIESRRSDKFVRVNRSMRRVIVDEEGLDVLYWRDLEGENINAEKEVVDRIEIFQTEEKNIRFLKPPGQESPFVREESFSFVRSRTLVKQESSVQHSLSTSRSPPLPTAVVSSSELPLQPLPPLPKKALDWDRVNSGSLRVEGDLMVALFGSVATNRKSPKTIGKISSPRGERSGPPSKIFILDVRKSENMSIIVRSLSVSRKEIVDALIEGEELEVDILEKLNRISPTAEEESKILAFDDDHTRLADAESFLYHVLKAVPSAFTRFKAMLLRSNYDSKVLYVKQSIRTLESGCKELRTRGLLPKVTEAVLKAGNQMNPGTSQGTAQAFDLTHLRKLSDVKSTDGTTTLLHFVLEEVVRAEGKHCMINRSHSLSRSSRNIKNSAGQILEKSMSIKDLENKYIMLGLPIVGGISHQFPNVKKAATLDYDALNKACSALPDNVAEIRKLVGECAISGGGEGFIRKMKSFIDSSEGESRTVKKELTSIMGLVKRTTEYHQAGASKDMWTQPLELFVIVKDFLAMVDQACIDITRNMQKRKTQVPASSSTAYKNSAKFPLLPANFMSDTSKRSPSDSDHDSKVV